MLEIIAFVAALVLVAIAASALTYFALRLSLWYGERQERRPDWNDGWTPEPEDLPRW